MFYRGKNKIWAFFAFANRSLLWQAKVCIFLITIFLALPYNSQASSLHTLSDKMSRGAPGVASDHLIKFTTPTGLNALDQYIRISFDSGFNLSAIDYTDIDLFHGSISGMENQEILNALPTSTAWGAQVSGSRIDLTHPNSAANGHILPNDKVIIKIGLNAAGGNQQIINPVTIGSKIISITSNNSDSGKLAVAIFRDQIGVRAGPEGSSVIPTPTPPPPPEPPPPTPEEEELIFEEETIFEKMGDVACDEGRCAYFSPGVILNGQKPLKTLIYINDSPYGVNYPTAISWEYPTNLNAGVNTFLVYAMDEYGQISNRITLEIKLYKVGDSNGDSIVNDFDLSTLVAHFGEPWCFSDFNMDNMVNDFDLSALARQWDGIY